MKQLDFLAVGDIVTEPFIRLKEAEIRGENEDMKICMRFGDKIPYDFAEVCRAVGNSANAAVSAARLGLSAGLVSDIGDDSIGKGNLEQLASEQVDASYITTHQGMKSNYHYVLWYESERTILVRHEEYPYAFPAIEPAPKLLYISSLGANSADYHAQIAAYIEKHPDMKVAFQPGTFQMRLGVEALKAFYERSYLFFCNKEESERILGLPSGTDIKELLSGLAAFGPKHVVITDGTNGAYAYDGTRSVFVPMYPDDRGPYERTGAGDAFASSVSAALALGLPFEEALLWGPINSMAVVQKIGAQQGLLTRKELDEHLAKAPSEYALRPL